MKKSLLITIFLLLTIAGADAFARPYFTFTTSSGNSYSRLSGSTMFNWNKSASTDSGDEDYSWPTAIGFTFNYNGANYSSFQVSTNGWLRFSSGGTDTIASAFSNNASTTYGGLNGLIRKVVAPLWDDLQADSAELNITYKLDGSAPNRVLTVEWKNIRWQYNAWSGVPNANFQVKLYETSNVIEYCYGYTNNPLNPSASIGLNDASNVSVLAQGYGTFLSINLGGGAGSRQFHQSMVYEFNAIAAQPDSGIILTFTPYTPSALSGTKTVGGASPDFATPSDAAMALNMSGVSGPVTLEFRDGTYDDIFHLANVAGTSATNTITVKPASGATVILSPRNGSQAGNSVTAGDAVIRLDGAQYVTVDAINVTDNTLNGSSTTLKFDMGIVLSPFVSNIGGTITQAGARFNTLKNLTVDMNAGGATPNNLAICIRFGTPANAISDSAKANSFNTISDVTLKDFWRAGIMMYGYVGSLPDKSNKITAVTRNYIDSVNITTGSALDVRCIEINAQQDLIIENTDIRNITNAVNLTNHVYGIWVNPGAGGDGIAGNVYIRNNKIYNLNLTSTSATSGICVGMQFNAVNPGTLHVYNNQIYNIFANGTTGSARAITFAVGGNVASYTVNVYNNMIYDIRCPRSTTTSSPNARGLDFQSSNCATTFNTYNNTIYLDGTPSAATHVSACVYISNFGTSTLDLRNNILINTQNSVTRAIAIYASANSNLLRLAPTSNNNLLYAGTPSATKLISYDATNSDQTLSAYQSRVATGGLGGPRELNAVTLSSLTGFFKSSSSPYDVHLDSTVANAAESAGQSVSMVTTDYDGQARGTYPDIGADEIGGTAVADVTGPLVSFTDQTNTNSTGNRTLAVTIADPTGVASGSDSPRLYYRKGALGSWNNDAAPSVSGTTYTFTASATAMGGLVANDTVFYYVAAQDLAGTPNLRTVPSGGTGTTPPGTTAPSTLKSYIILDAPLSGSYTVGVAAFNKVTGRNLYPVTLQRKVTRLEPLPATEEEKAAVLGSQPRPTDRLYEENDYRDVTYMPFYDPLQFSKSRYKETEVTEDYSVLYENGAPYSGPQFVAVSKEQLAARGYNLAAVDGIEGVYTTLTAAVAALNSRGVSGATTLLLVDNGTYASETYPINFNAISGVSATNTITVKPNTGVAATFTSASATNLFKIQTSYVTIDGSNAGSTDRSLTISTTSTSAAQVVWLASLNAANLTGVTVKNCNIYGGSTSSGTATIPLLVCDATTSTAPGVFTNITLQNNNIRKGRDGIYVNGGSLPQGGNTVNILDNNLLADNVIAVDSLQRYGIYIQGVNTVTISGNQIGNFESVTNINARPIWLASSCENVVVERNRISNVGYRLNANGANAIAVSVGLSNANVAIRNNMIWDIRGGGSNSVNANALGIYLFGAQSGINVYNNSIYMYGNWLLSTTSAAAMSQGILFSSGTYGNVVNNIIVNNHGQSAASPATTNGAGGIFCFQSIDQAQTLNYNNYYIQPTNGQKSIGWVNGTFAGFGALTISSWNAATGKDANSVYGNPNYVSTTNLHIDTTMRSVAADAGTVLGSVTNDYDGNSRSGSYPDLGADEFNGINTVQPMALTALIEGLYDSGGDVAVSDTVKVYMRNASAPYALVDSATVVLSTSGTGTANFSQAAAGTSYYFQVYHRSAIETWFGSTLPFTNSRITYNMTTGATQAYGSNMVLKGSKYCLYSGDVNQDGIADLNDLISIDNDNANFEYHIENDVNMDAIVDLNDMIIVDNNNASFVGKVVPSKKLGKTGNHVREVKKITPLD